TAHTSPLALHDALPICSRVICAGDRSAVRISFPCILPDRRTPSVPKSEILSPKGPLVATRIHDRRSPPRPGVPRTAQRNALRARSEEHTSELQSRFDLV